MTYGYDLERMVVALENVENAAQGLVCSHELEDWLLYRLAHIRAEAHSLRVEIKKTKGSKSTTRISTIRRALYSTE